MPESLTLARDERGIVLSAPIPYTALQALVQVLSLAGPERGEAETLRDKVWPYWEKAGLSHPQETRVPCDVLRAATLCLRRWHAADPKHRAAFWTDDDDTTLTHAWRDGLSAPA